MPPTTPSGNLLPLRRNRTGPCCVYVGEQGPDRHGGLVGSLLTGVGPCSLGRVTHPTPLTVRAITTAEHAAHVAARSSASFLQTPGWAQVKPEWRAESLGWFRRRFWRRSSSGVALVLYRQLPRLKRYLAYLPEGPVMDWEAPRDDDLDAWLAPMTAHLTRQGAFGVRMGPPVVTRRWSAAQVKEGIADEAVHRLTDVPPLERSPTGAAVVVPARRSSAGGPRPSRAASPPVSRSTTSSSRSPTPTAPRAPRTTSSPG